MGYTGSPSPRPAPLGRGRMVHRLSITPVPEFAQLPLAKDQSGACCSLSLRERVRVRGKFWVELASWSISKRNQRSHRPAFQLFTSLQEAQFDEEADLQNFPAGLLHERGGSGGGAAGGQQVVHQQNAAARFEGVHVNGNSIRAVFQVIALLVSPVWKLALLADWHETRPQLDRDRSGENETPRVDAHDGVHRAGRVVRCQQIDAAVE